MCTRKVRSGARVPPPVCSLVRASPLWYPPHHRRCGARARHPGTGPAAPARRAGGPGPPPPELSRTRATTRRRRHAPRRDRGAAGRAGDAAGPAARGAAPLGGVRDDAGVRARERRRRARRARSGLGGWGRWRSGPRSASSPARRSASSPSRCGRVARAGAGAGRGRAREAPRRLGRGRHRFHRGALHCRARLPGHPPCSTRRRSGSWSAPSPRAWPVPRSSPGRAW